MSIEISNSDSKDGGVEAIWLCGFRSSKQGEKALAIDRHISGQGGTCIRLDYRGHGADEERLKDYCLSDWIEDAHKVLSQNAGCETILIGSSMGGYIALLLLCRYLASKESITIGGLILIAPAIDMTQRLLLAKLSESQKAILDRDGSVEIPAKYGLSPTVITQKLIDDGLTYSLLSKPGRSAIAGLSLPIHTLHGRLDEDVPLSLSETLISQLTASDATLSILPDGDHRLSRPQDIALLIKAYDAMRLTLSANLAGAQ